MPLIGTVRGNFGYGRMIRVEPGPILTVFNPVTLQRSTFPLNTTPSIILDGDRYRGNSYVISSSVGIDLTAKIWGGGGGSTPRTGLGNNGMQPSGAGSAALGTLVLDPGVEYTIFIGGAGRKGGIYYVPSSDQIRELSGWGGAASGIVRGNVFALGSSFNSTTLVENHMVIVGGGGGGGDGDLSDSVAKAAGGGGGRNINYGTERYTYTRYGSLLKGFSDNDYLILAQPTDTTTVSAYTPSGFSGVEGAELITRISEKNLGIGGASDSYGSGGGGLIGGGPLSGGSSSSELVPSSSEQDNVYSVFFNGSSTLTTEYDATFSLAGVDFTIECWIYSTYIPPSANPLESTSIGIFTIAQPVNMQTFLNTPHIYFCIDSNSISFLISSTYIINVPYQLPLATWVHLALTRMGNTWRLFANGIMIEQRDYNYTIPSTFPSAEVSIGSRSHVDSFFKGYISNFRIVKNASLYTNYFSPPTTPLTVSSQGTTVLLTCQNLTIKDNSSENSTFTFEGVPRTVKINPFDSTDGNWKIFSASFTVPGLYDDPQRGTAGDQGKPGRAVLTINEHVATTITATGGTITEVPIPGTSLSYKYHTFTNNGTFQITAAGANDRVEIFAIGGGGGGGFSGGGAGEAVIANNLNLKVGSYPVVIGNGGTKVDMSDAYNWHITGSIIYKKALGGIWGGARGEDTSLITNDLAQYGFPDNYRRLIARLKYSTYYISPDGSPDNTGLTPSSPWPSVQVAEEKIRDMIYDPTGPNYHSMKNDGVCFVLLPGEYYVAEPGARVNYTYFCRDSYLDFPNSSEANYFVPRVFVCAPGQVVLNIPAGSFNYCAYFRNKLSAVYGAIFRKNYTQFDTNAYANTLFPEYNSNSDSTHFFGGSFYNCVFDVRDQTYDWIMHGRAWEGYFENCLFLSERNETNGGIVGWLSYYSLFKSCLFNKQAFTRDAAVIADSQSNVEIDYGTYLPTTASTKGVGGGTYSWSGTKTQIGSLTPVSVVASGGGGGILTGRLHLHNTPEFYNFGPGLNSIGGSGGGATYLVSSNVFDDNKEYNRYYGSGPNYGADANVSYSYFSSISVYSTERGPGENTNDFGPRASGGGGVFSPGAYHEDEGQGGLPIEWPIGSGAYYGSGGPSRSTIEPSDYPGSGGRGTAQWNPQTKYLDWGSDFKSNANATDGKKGVLIVRYKVTGSSTPVSNPLEKINPVVRATQNSMTTTTTYRQHVFTESGTFTLNRLPDNCVLEVIVVGGGGGTASVGYTGRGGYGGEVRYAKFNSSTIPLGNYAIQVGKGGGAGGYPYGPSGGYSGFFGMKWNARDWTDNISILSNGGSGAWYSGGATFLGTDGTLINFGLFSDNTTYYGGNGGGGKNTTDINARNLGGLGGSGSGAINGVNATPARANSGGGGGGPAPNGNPSAGADGIVIIRYTYFS